MIYHFRGGKKMKEKYEIVLKIEMKALSRLARKGRIEKIARGFYAI